ncbi:phosphopantetheine adenylyltransferase [Caldiplasma sukawensis]
MEEYTVVAGTFSTLHRGHKKLINAAIETGLPIIIGLTSDNYSRKTKTYPAVSFEERKKVIEKYLNDKNVKFSIKELDNNTGDAATNSFYKNIVVSRETEKNAMKINEKRINNGLPPMKIITVESEMAQDHFLISSRRIVSGEIDCDGKRLIPIEVALFCNSKIRDIVENNILRFFYNSPISFSRKDFHYEYVKDYSEFYREAIISIEDKDFSISISPTINYNPMSKLNEFSFASYVLDRYGRTFFGRGFSVPVGSNNTEYAFSHVKKEIIDKMVESTFTSISTQMDNFWDFGNYYQDLP